MRLNRLAQIGLAIMAIVLVWLLVSSLFRGRNTTTVAQDNTADPNFVQVNDTSGQPVSQGGRRGYVARYNIPERSLLTRDMFIEDTSGGDRDEDVYVTNFLEQGYGYITRVAIPKGRHLQHDQLLGSVRELGVSAAVGDGFRAMTVAVPNKPTLHSIVSIGDFVDVVATFDQAETRVLADGVRVLAVDGFARDYDKGSVKKRGPNSEGPEAVQPPAPGATPVPGQRPGEPVPTPVPQGNQPPPAREAALTLEVRPEQATAISFAIAAAAPLDYLIQPRPTTLAAPQITTARVTKAQVAPYALVSKRTAGGTGAGGTTRGGTTATTVSTGGRRTGGGGGGGSSWNNPPMPAPGSIGLPPAPATSFGPAPTPEKPRTYDITIYPDGLPPRINTVPIPE